MMYDDEFRIYGLSMGDVLKLRAFWLEHHTKLPHEEKKKEITESEFDVAYFSVFGRYNVSDKIKLKQELGF